RSARVMGMASARRLVRAAMAGGRWSDWWDCCATESVGAAAIVAAEVKRKRRRSNLNLCMGVVIVAGRTRRRFRLGALAVLWGSGRDATVCFWPLWGERSE